MAWFINLTPHDVCVFKEDGTSINFKATGEVARVKVKSKEIGRIAGIPVMKNFYSDVEGLPDPDEDTFYIVSKIVADAVPYRNDVLIPNDSVRDIDGRIIGCMSLAHI